MQLDNNSVQGGFSLRLGPKSTQRTVSTVAFTRPIPLSFTAAIDSRVSVPPYVTLAPHPAVSPHVGIAPDISLAPHLAVPPRVPFTSYVCVPRRFTVSHGLPIARGVAVATRYVSVSADLAFSWLVRLEDPVAKRAQPCGNGPNRRAQNQRDKPRRPKADCLTRTVGSQNMADPS
jgi:hypothetical protein